MCALSCSRHARHHFLPVHALQTERTGGLVVDGLFRCFKAGTEAPLEDVYAVGDVAAFPLTMEVR